MHINKKVLPWCIARTLGLVAFILVTSCAPVTRGPGIDQAEALKEAEKQREFAVKEYIRIEKRLKHVAWGIQQNATFLCEDHIKKRAGLNLTTKRHVTEHLRPTYEKLFQIVEDRPTVLYPLPGSPAEKAGLRSGDIVTQINGAPLSRGSDDIENVMQVIEKAGRVISLEVQRKKEKKTVTLAPRSICAYPAYLAHDETVNAFADGERVIVTMGMMRFVESDDELALIIGHELAHNTMSHIQKKQGNILAGRVVGAVVDVFLGGTGIFAQLGESVGGGLYSQDFESEADYIGVYYAAAAGYNVKNAAHLWRRMAASNPAAIHLRGSTHPSTAKRFLAIGATADEVADKSAKGLPLVPSLGEKSTVEQVP